MEFFDVEQLTSNQQLLKVFKVSNSASVIILWNSLLRINSY